MSKIVCYTAIVGPYDQLREVKVKSDGIDYVCFTDQPFVSNTWQIRPIPDELKFLSNVKKQRVIKICPHRFLSEYDISIWIDGNLQVKRDLNEFVAQYDLSKNVLYTRVHPVRDCIYDEAKKILELKKDTAESINAQVERYRAMGYPAHIGMSETCVLLRKHNDIKCKLFCNAWATELLLNSHRDQMSFNFICWRDKFLPGYLTKQFKIAKNDFFDIATGHAAKVKYE